jgi:hypothetical protein
MSVTSARECCAVARVDVVALGGDFAEWRPESHPVTARATSRDTMPRFIFTYDAPTNPTVPTRTDCPRWDASDERLRFDGCAELEVEGFVANRVDNPYPPGIRSGAWLKLKTAEWKSAPAPMRHSVGTGAARRFGQLCARGRDRNAGVDA